MALVLQHLLSDCLNEHGIADLAMYVVETLRNHQPLSQVWERLSGAFNVVVEYL